MFTVIVWFSIRRLVVFYPVTLNLTMTAPANASWFLCWMGQSARLIRCCFQRVNILGYRVSFPREVVHSNMFLVLSFSGV